MLDRCVVHDFLHKRAKNLPCARSNNLSPTIWARLPLELIREIFSILAMTSSQKARELRLVSSDINVLVLPLLFRHINIIKPDDVRHLTTVLLPKRKNHIPALKS